MLASYWLIPTLPHSPNGGLETLLVPTTSALSLLSVQSLSFKCFLTLMTLRIFDLLHTSRVLTFLSSFYLHHISRSSSSNRDIVLKAKKEAQIPEIPTLDGVSSAWSRCIITVSVTANCMRAHAGGIHSLMEGCEDGMHRMRILRMEQRD